MNTAPTSSSGSGGTAGYMDIQANAPVVKDDFGGFDDANSEEV
jgi:hypothetical protein